MFALKVTSAFFKAFQSGLFDHPLSHLVQESKTVRRKDGSVFQQKFWVDPEKGKPKPQKQTAADHLKQSGQMRQRQGGPVEQGDLFAAPVKEEVKPQPAQGGLFEGHKFDGVELKHPEPGKQQIEDRPKGKERATPRMEREPAPIVPEHVEKLKRSVEAGRAAPNDRYHEENLQLVFGGIDNRGEEIWRYPFRPDLFHVSDATKRPVRHYYTLDNGAIVHPDELHRLRVKRDAKGNARIEYVESDPVKVHSRKGAEEFKSLKAAMAAASKMQDQREPITVESVGGTKVQTTAGEFGNYVGTTDSKAIFEDWHNKHESNLAQKAKEAQERKAWELLETHPAIVQGAKIDPEWTRQYEQAGQLVLETHGPTVPMFKIPGIVNSNLKGDVGHSIQRALEAKTPSKEIPTTALLQAIALVRPSSLVHIRAENKFSEVTKRLEGLSLEGGNAKAPQEGDDSGPAKHEQWAIENSRLSVGDTKTEDGVTYQLNENHRWEKVEGVTKLGTPAKI